MSKISSTAMVLAAGYGMKMRPLTLTKPKPLHEVGGRAMIDHALDKLVGAGVTRAVVNSFYLAEQIEEHVKRRTDIDIVISREEVDLLETGGGVVNAMPHFDGDPLYVLNSDLPWVDGPVPSLQRMADFWDPARMDALLLLMPTDKALGFVRNGRPADGDYFPSPEGKITRKDTLPPRPTVYIGAQIIKPSMYAKPPAAVFSNNVIWDRIEAQDRLFGILHDGSCYHVSTAESLRDANERLASGKGWVV